MGAKNRVLAAVCGLSLVTALGGGIQAADVAKKKVDTQVSADTKELLASRKTPECGVLPDSPGPIPGWFAERCIDAPKAQPETPLTPNVTLGPILVQEVSTNTVRSTSVAGIATLTSFGALVPPQATDFPADFIRLTTDTQRVYQITSSGAVSRYTTAGTNVVLSPIPPAAGSTWSDTATDPTTGTVYAAAIVGACASSTLSTLNVPGGTSTPIGPITNGGCIISLAADNTGVLYGIDIVADTLVRIDKVTGAGTVVGAIGYNANFGQAMDCDPGTGTCYAFTINVTAGNTTELRSVNTTTGATVFVGTIGSISPGGSPQVAGAVFHSITCTNDDGCSDGNLCNGVETCQASVCTAGTPVVCPDDGLFCTIDTCVPSNGLCGVPNPCSDGDTCTVDTCIEDSDSCTHTTPAPVQFCNSGAITIPSSGAATPYPATIAVSGLPNSAALCAVRLSAISHTWPGDIDILLVGPVATTQNATIMSDVASGNFPVTGVNLILKDAAAASLPTGGPLVSGTFKPTNVGTTADAFPAPAPTANVASSLAIFSGNPNGTWKLYVADDFTGDSGSIGQGWCVDIVPTGCTTAADCNDGNPCTDEACTNSQCVYTNNTVACSDGNACTLNDVCSGGVCVSGTPQTCDDGDACTANNCNTGTGACEFPAITCDDSNSCTDDSCNSASGCVFTNNDANACSDNNLCTSPDVCVAGACVGQNPVICAPDANPCTTEQCNPATGNCDSVNNNSACDDGDICTTNDACGPALFEDFDGEIAPNLPGTWTTGATNDGVPWETTLVSADTLPNSAFGADIGGPTASDEVLISPPINIVSASAQLTFRNRWSFENATTCYDAGVLEIDIAGGGFTDIVTAGGSFVSGGYTGTVSTAFGNPLAGRSAWCNASPGYPSYLTTVVNLPAAAAGQTIQLQWRIGFDVSVAGTGQNIDSIVLIDGTHRCNPGVPIDCDDLNPCTDDYCDVMLGCQHANNTEACDDGNACTQLDACSGGACTGQALVCDDSNPCTVDTCDSVTGCQFTPVPAPGEVEGVTAAADKTTYTWTPTASATQYDLVRGRVSLLPVGPGGGDESCFPGIAFTNFIDPTLPAPGASFFYLLRAKNSCGTGGYGNEGILGLPGPPRVTTSCP